MGGQDSLYSLRTFLTSHDKHWFYSQERKGESTSSGPPAARGPPSPAHPACAPLPRPSSSRPSLTRPPAPWTLAPRSSRLPPGPKVAASLPASSAPSPASGGLGSRVFPCPPAPAAPLAASGSSGLSRRPLRSPSWWPSHLHVRCYGGLAPRLSPPALLTPCSAAPVRGPGPACLVSGLLYTLLTPTSPATAQTRPPKGTGCVATAPLVQRFPGDRHRPLSPCFREWRLPQTPEPESHPWTAEPCPPHLLSSLGLASTSPRPARERLLLLPAAVRPPRP